MGRFWTLHSLEIIAYCEVVIKILMSTAEQLIISLMRGLSYGGLITACLVGMRMEQGNHNAPVHCAQS